MAASVDLTFTAFFEFYHLVFVIVRLSVSDIMAPIFCSESLNTFRFQTTKQNVNFNAYLFILSSQLEIFR